MHEQVSDILDIVLCVILAALCLATGVSAAVRDNREVRQYTSSYSEKNTTLKYSPSEKLYEQDEGTVSKEELVIMTQIQDFEMYGPRVFVCNGSTVDLHPGMDAYRSTNRSAIWNAMRPDPADAAYRVLYEYEKYVWTVQAAAPTP